MNKNKEKKKMSIPEVLITYFKEEIIPILKKEGAVYLFTKRNDPAFNDIILEELTDLEYFVIKVSSENGVITYDSQNSKAGILWKDNESKVILNKRSMDLSFSFICTQNLVEFGKYRFMYYTKEDISHLQNNFIERTFKLVRNNLLEEYYSDEESKKMVERLRTEGLIISIKMLRNTSITGIQEFFNQRMNPNGIYVYLHKNGQKNEDMRGVLEDHFSDTEIIEFSIEYDI
jgi:hypothetical protein